ncbi:hypothetical protein Vafri_12568 [Volvox africanus]|uniref:HNH nuclease domain-containing protein n=1 Tax=Volvox africanus TaxID=51714 RepID=A0A8J4B9R3_9CHLO|nr:hypothetical protein Vafri_12568 [Volvox africanus]
MITKGRILDAIRAETSAGAELGTLLSFVCKHEEELHRWPLQDSDDHATIAAFVRDQAGAGCSVSVAGLGVESTTGSGMEAAGPGPGSMMSTMDMVREVMEAAVQPAVEAAMKPAIEAAVQPAVEAAMKPAIEAAVQPAVEAAMKPAIEAAVQPAVEAAVRKMLRHYYDLNFTPRSASSRYTVCRKDALEYYTGSREDPSSILCAVSGICLPAKDVIAGHIYQLRWHMLEGLDLDRNAPSNILFMQKKIETAFDNFEITVLPVHHKVFLLRQSISNLVAFEYILDADNTAADGSTSGGISAGPKKQVLWGELHQKELSLPGINKPSDEALLVHAQRAFRFAVKNGWYRKSDVPALSYGDNEILRRFLADADSGGSGVGGDLGCAKGNDFVESSQVSNSEGIGEV